MRCRMPSLHNLPFITLLPRASLGILYLCYIHHGPIDPLSKSDPSYSNTAKVNTKVGVGRV
jgi:hypothetical protein